MRILRPGRRESLFAFLYFCEGAPIGFIWWALPAYWASLGVPVEHITTIVAVTVLPWTFKWLWAPLVDWTAPSVGYQSWIVAAQAIMGLALLPLVWLDPVDQFPGLLLSLVLHALAAATQDVAIDGLCVATVERHERGAINGWMQTGMLLGRALFGGGAVLIMAAGTVTAGVTLLVALLWTSACGMALWSRRGQHRAPIAAVQRPPWRQSLRWIVGRAETWLALAFALLAGSSFETVGAVLGPYLSSMELRLTQVGLFQIGPLAGAMALGALFGGRISDRFGHARVAWYGLLTIVLLSIGLAAGEFVPATRAGIQLSLIAAIYLAIGVFTASSYALFMDLAHGPWQATVFSALMGVTNACEAVSAIVAGSLVVSLGYAATFTIMTIPSLVGLAIVPHLRRRD